MKRYQECTWLQKRWRDRWLFLVPIWLAEYYWITRKLFRLNFIDAFWMTLSEADLRRNKYLTMEELRSSLPEFFNDL